MQQHRKGLMRFGRAARTLTPVEEKVLRMRHGIKARGFTRLEKSGDGNQDVAQQLARLELRILAQHQEQGANTDEVVHTLPRFDKDRNNNS